MWASELSGRRAAVLGALVVATLLATAPAAVPAASAEPARHVVSLAPSVTEIVYALGAGERLVGVCAQCDRPPAVERLPRVGGYLSPSVEAVVARRPDLVVAVPSPGNREAVRAVERTGIRVLVVRDRTLADLWASVHAVAAALGMDDAGDRLVAEVKARLDAVRARVAALPRRRVLVVVGHRPLVAVGSGTLQDELLAVAGAENVAGDAGGPWPTLALEVVVARAPDVIVDVSMGTDRGARELFAGLTTVPAVRDGRVVRLESDAFLRAGPRVADAAEALAALVHPEAFPHGEAPPG